MSDIKFWLIRTGVLRDLHDSPDTLRLLAKHLEIEMDNQDPVEYMQFVISNALAEEMEADGKYRFERAKKLREQGLKP